MMPFTVAIPSYNDLYRWENGLFEEYLNRYADEIDPPVLSLDYYPIGLGGNNDSDQLDNSKMWMDLGLMREICRRKDMPLWFYYQAVNLHRYPHYEFPMTRMMMYAAAMYGAKALSSTPPSERSSSSRERRGRSSRRRRPYTPNSGIWATP